MRTLSSTVLPLVLAFGVVVVLLVAARRPAQRVAEAKPTATLLSIWTGGTASFVLAMVAYCGAQAHGFAHCVRPALTEGVALSGLSLVAALLVSRRSPST